MGNKWVMTWESNRKEAMKTMVMMMWPFGEMGYGLQ